jgi:hypothetical protein
VTTPVTASQRDTVLDALAVFMACERGATSDAEAMFASYDATGETPELIAAVVALASCAVRYAAMVRGVPPARLLAGIANEVRNLP